MRKILCILLAAVIGLSLLSACGEQSDAGQIENGHTLYFRDTEKRDAVSCVFYNSDSEESTEVKMTLTGESDGDCIYSCEGDASAYHMAYFQYDGFKTPSFAFNRCVSGWYNSEHGFLPYTEGKEICYENEFEEVTLTFNGYDKLIHIWKPDDYDPDAQEPYATVYLLDGQAMVYLGFPGETYLDSEHADVQVQSMIEATGYQAIVVAVDTYGNEMEYSRLDELVPDIGEMAYDEDTKKCGNLFADFFVDTLIPYVQQHYNVYDDALHTSVVGKSLSGLEAFYIAMEHPDQVGTAGILSPSFWIYNDDVWRAYLSQKTFAENASFLYFYSGNEVDDTGKETTEMVERLKVMGYPADRYVYHYTENGGHIVAYWRAIFSEFLEAMVFQEVVPLKS